MRLFQRDYLTQQEAAAFEEGVMLVNDEDITPCPEGPQTIEGMVRVYVHDWAPLAPEDVCPVCGAGKSEDEEE